MQNQKIIIIFGAPGAGKGYLSTKLLATKRFIHYSPGSIMRNILQNPNQINYRLLFNCINTGKLVPAPIVKKIIMEKISEQNKKIVILDGYPRNNTQKKDLELICVKNNAKIIAIFYLKINFRNAQKRISNRVICLKCEANFNLLTDPPKSKNKCDYCQHALVRRKDDDKIMTRFRIFNNKTMPIILKYAKSENFHEVDSIVLEKSIPKIVKMLYSLK